MFSYIFSQIWLNQVTDDSRSNYITKLKILNIKFITIIIIIIIIELFLGR
jgi:hypothetical protein